jgi:hypothetical protein
MMFLVIPGYIAGPVIGLMLGYSIVFEMVSAADMNLPDRFLRIIRAGILCGALAGIAAGGYYMWHLGPWAGHGIRAVGIIPLSGAAAGGGVLIVLRKRPG